MNKSNLNILLQDYEQKRLNAEIDLNNRKENLLKNNKDLSDIENQINLLSIKKIKLILNSKKDEIDKINIEIENLKNKKNIILKKLNIDKNFFKPNYECKICNDTGFITKNNKTVMCKCLKQKIFNIDYNEANIGNLKNENFSKFSYDYYSDKIDLEKYGLNLSPKENMKSIMKIINSFIKNFDKPNEKNLLFIGDTGLGKTFLCNCIAYELLKNGKTVLYQTAPIMLDKIINYRFSKDYSSDNIIENIYNVDLLIIDDLGTETLNSIKLTELFNIINTRILNQNNKITKTIISTNLNLKDIFEIYNERIGSRLVGNYNILKFLGDDIRLKKK